MKRLMRTFLVSFGFAWFWAGAALFAWSVLPTVALFTRDPVLRIRRCQKIVSRCFRAFQTYMRSLGLVDARISVELDRPHPGPIVVVANHPTLIDVTAMVARFPHLCVLAKPTYANNPIIGRLLRLCGFICAGEGMSEMHSGIALAIERIHQGFDVLVFPEGTRSPAGGLHTFRRGAFEIACQARVPILPVVLRCEPSALTKGRPVWQHPDRVAVLTTQVLPLVDPAEFEYQSRPLRESVENSYRRELASTLSKLDRHA